MRFFKRQPKVGGAIAYHGLEQWWFSQFDEQERSYLNARYAPYSNPPRKDVLIHGRISSSTQTVTALLSGIISFLDWQKDVSLVEHIRDEGVKQATSKKEWLDLHFLYQNVVKFYYRRRELDDVSLDRAIEACLKQIELAPKAAKSLLAQPYFDELPNHHGYKQLAIIREKAEDYTHAIELSKQAMEQGWNGDWEKRIERCQKKMNKSS